VLKGDAQVGLRRLKKDRMLVDKNLQRDGLVKKYPRLTRCHFSPELGLVFALSIRGNFVSKHDADLRRRGEVAVRKAGSKENLQITDFAFSEKHLRVASAEQIGVCTKDPCLYFFDAIDDFRVENKFELHAFTKDVPTRIWFVEFMGYWLTADAKCCLSFWNLPDQQLEKKLAVRRQATPQPQVQDIKPIEPLKLLVVATSDKVLSIFDTQELKNLLNLSMEQGGFNAMDYFESYQLLLVAGFENTVKVFSVTPEHYELNSLGRLVGHVSIVNAVAVVEGSAMALSCDDRCVVKLWDVRKLACIQTVPLASKANIGLLLHLPGRSRVLFAGERLSCMDFEDASSHTEQREAPVAQACELNECSNELFLATKSEVRVLDFATGRLKRIHVNLVDKDRPDAITAFKLLQKKNLFILGDADGVVNLYNAASGDLLRRSKPHLNSVTAVRLDNLNDMLVSASADASIKVQVEQDLVALQLAQESQPDEVREFFRKPMLLEGYGHSEFEKYRREVLDLVQATGATDLVHGSRQAPDALGLQTGDLQAEDNISLVRGIDRCNGNLEVALLEVCVYHNLVAASSADCFVYLYNYEFIRPVGQIELEPHSEAASLLFLTGYAKLLVGTSAGNLFIFSWQFESLTSPRRLQTRPPHRPREQNGRRPLAGGLARRPGAGPAHRHRQQLEVQDERQKHDAPLRRPAHRRVFRRPLPLRPAELPPARKHLRQLLGQLEL